MKNEATMKYKGPPPLVHDLRARSAKKLFKMIGNPGNRGFALRLMKYIDVRMNKDKTFAEKAISLAYLCSFLVDHFVFAVNSAHEKSGSMKMMPEQERCFWEEQYSSAIERKLEKLPDSEHIRGQLDRLYLFSALPLNIHIFRERHPALISRWHSMHGMAGEMHAALFVARVLDNKRTSPAAKARAVRLAASKMADLECRFEHVPWPDAYRHVMTELYPCIARHPDALEALV